MDMLRRLISCRIIIIIIIITHRQSTKLNSTRWTLCKVDCQGRFGPVHTGNKVDRIGNKIECIGNKFHRDKLSNSRCCGFIAKASNTVEHIGNKV